MSIIDELKQNEGKKNPLKTIWNIFSICAGVLSLSSISESFIKWREFIIQVINCYRSIIHPIFEFLFSWIPITIPTYIYDYFVLGMMVSASYLRALHAADKIQGYSFGLLPSDLYGENILKIIVAILLRILGWPIIMVKYLIKLFEGFSESNSFNKWQDHFDRNPPLKGNKEERVRSMVIVRCSQAL